jgi:hypothetical protein
MRIRSKVARIAVVSLAAGSLIVAGLASAAPASADEPSPIAGQGQILTPWWLPQHPNVPFFYYGRPYPHRHVFYYQRPVQYVYYQPPYQPVPYVNYANYNYLWPFYGYFHSTLPYYMSTGAVSVTGAQSAAAIAATGQVLGLSPQAVVGALGQGKSLAQIAAERGWDRASFINAVNGVFQARVSAAIAAGVVSPAAASSVLYSLTSYFAANVDQPGGVVLQGNANLYYQIFQ